MNINYKQSDLTIIIPARNEAKNLAKLLPRIRRVVSSTDINVDIVVVDEQPDPETRMNVEKNECFLLSPYTRGYGGAIIAGINHAQSEFIITMDADFSHSPDFLIDLWRARHSADIIIASRYVPGGKAIMPLSRLLLSKIINVVFSRGLDLSVRDMSSGFRLYRTKPIKNLNLIRDDFDIQQEILVKTLAKGYIVREIPFTYQPRRHGSSHARVFRFGISYLKTFSSLWLLRNSIHSADYDDRAYDSWVIIQRYWQRQRYKHIVQLSKEYNRIIDIGCGSSRILEALTPDSVGLDIQLRKLRYARKFLPDLIQGSALELPVKTGYFSCVICSQVIEHIEGQDVLSELDRILKDGGRLILGTPDYGNWQWRFTEWFYGKLLPQAYADEHITHYTRDRLIKEFVEERGYSLQAIRYILQGELILALQKPIERLQN